MSCSADLLNMDLVEDERGTPRGTPPPRKHTRSVSLGPLPTTSSTPIPACPSVSPVSSQGDHKSPRLGNFAKLRLPIRPKAREITPSRPESRDIIDTSDRQQPSLTCSGQPETAGGIENVEQPPLMTLKLGNFAKIFQKLGTSEQSAGDDGSVASSTSKLFSRLPPVDIPGAKPKKATSHRKAKNASPVRGDFSDSDASAFAGFDTDPGFVTDLATPPTSWDDVLSRSDERLKSKAIDSAEETDINEDLQAQMHRAKLALRKAQAQGQQPDTKPKDWLCEWYIQGGPRHVIQEDLLTRKGSYELLCQNMIPLTAHDAMLAKQFPEAADNGVHVFVDYSNINISFQKFVKDYYDVPENARLVPSLNINLAHLHALSVRGRLMHTLFAGGSIGPKDKHEPAFVLEFRDLGYTVDLRERVRAEDPSFRGLKRSSARTSDNEHPPIGLSAPGQIRRAYSSPSKDKGRYREEFVDESLQSRIASTTLDYLDYPGTLIFVTGDGKPAPYADGFVRYAERALKRGFHVEVVSWSRSLSREWETLRDWQDDETDLPAGQFRVIELDAFWRELIPVYAD